MKRFFVAANSHWSGKLSFYQLLGVHPNASAKEIKSQYYKLCKTAHPDAGGDTTARFIQLTEAYNTLKDPKLRREYDRQRAIVEYKTPKPVQPVQFSSPPKSPHRTSSHCFWTAQQRNQEKYNQEARRRLEEDMLDSVVKRNRLLVLGAVAIGYIMSLFR